MAYTKRLGLTGTLTPTSGSSVSVPIKPTVKT
jgi:hypothetical protein